MRQTYYRFLITLWALIPAGILNAGEALKPVLPLNLTWKQPAAGGALKNDRELLQSNAVTKKALEDFNDATAALRKNLPPAEQSRQIGILRQASLKLGPRAKLLADLLAARVSSGLSASGGKSGKPSGNWRGLLLSACNTAAKIDEVTHEQTALQALTIWRRVEGNDAPWSTPPIDLKAQKKFSFFKAVIERQAIYDWSKGQETGAFKKYRSLSSNLNGSPEGAAVDLRIAEMERSFYNRQTKDSRNVRRYQKVLIETADKYQDKGFLGPGNEATVGKISAVMASEHKKLINSLIQEALSAKAPEQARKQTLNAVELYLGTNIDDQEKERVRAATGEIQFNAADHKAAAGTFAALATESTGSKSVAYWRKAIRSQTVLAHWPVEAPWTGIPKGDMEPREVLLDMYQKIDGGTAADWGTAAHIGLLMIANAKGDAGYQLWLSRLEKFPGGSNASRAAGWMIASRVAAKQWDDAESLGRLMVRHNITGIYLTRSFRAREVLGLALVENGLTALQADDFKKAVAKLQEFVKGWRGDPRHDEGMYHLALALQGDQQYRAAVLQLEAHVKAYPRSKWHKDALVNGGAWTLALTWDDHVMFFLEAHAKEYPNDDQTASSLQTLTDLYLGREIYDSAIRVMTIQLARPNIDDGTRVDVARRLLTTAERQASGATALRIADKLLASFKQDQSIQASAMGAKARAYAKSGNRKALAEIDRLSSQMDQSVPAIADTVSEIKFLLAEATGKDQFKEEVFSLGTRDPKAQLEKGYSLYTKIDNAYKSACLPVRSGWCGPALYRAARVGEAFLKAYGDLSIAKTLDPEDVSAFQKRKTAIMEGIETMVIESDEKALEQAKTGATNPDWTSAIMWQNGSEWNQEKYTGETSNHFIQWHTR